MKVKFKLNVMSKQKMSDWMERLVERYSIPSEDEKPTKILTEEQLKNIEDGKSKGIDIGYNPLSGEFEDMTKQYEDDAYQYEEWKKSSEYIDMVNSEF